MGRWLVWRIGARVVALPLAVYVNRRFLAGPAPRISPLPDFSWTRAEQQKLLARSEARLANLENKGQGVATVCAVVAAAISVAVSLTWQTAGFGERLLLAAAGWYALTSLAAPIRLVGPIERSTITADQLSALAGLGSEAEEELAHAYAQASADNDRSTQRLSNLLAASRNDVALAAIGFIMWVCVAVAEG